MHCSRCGSEEAHDYGSDGLVYCSACSFYGMNKPCWKCLMYLPAVELQTYRGQWTCQYCIMDLRDAERAAEAKHTARAGSEASTPSHHESESSRYGPESEFEHCDRCKRKLTIVYIFNNRKLCENCVDKEKDQWSC